MTREEIIRLAEEAKVMIAGDAAWRLCELVAAAEREACAEICDRNAEAWSKIEELSDWRKGYLDGLDNCADAIRARGAK